MRKNYCQKKQANNDMIFGRKQQPMDVIAEKQQSALKYIRSMNVSKEDKFFAEIKQTNSTYDQFLEKMNTFKIQQKLIDTKHRFQADNKYSNLLDHVPEEKEDIKTLKTELETYINRYTYQSQGKPPSRQDFYYFI